jgi:hypothetical protein
VRLIGGGDRPKRRSALRAAPAAGTIACVPKRRVVTGALFVAFLLPAVPARADQPGTYGGPSDRVCGPAAERRIQVGATRVSCRVARRVAAGVVLRGDRHRRWRCPGARAGSAYGHCHGRGSRRGAIVHWGLND